MPNSVRNTLFALLLFFPLIAGAETAPEVNVTGSVRADSSRIIFKMDLSGSFSASLSGNKVQIDLPVSIHPNFQGMLKALNKQVSSASIEQKGRRVVIRLNVSDVTIRKLKGKGFFGVDIVPAKKKEANKPEVAKEKDKQKPAAKKMELAKSRSGKKEEARKPVKKKATTEKKTEEEPEVRSTVQRSEEANRIAPEQATKLFTLPWEKIVSAAIFVRGENLWLVFDHFKQVSVKDLKSSRILDAKQIPDRQTTILKLMPSEELIKNPDWIWANREKNNWVLYYGKPPAEKIIPVSTPEDNGQNEIKLAIKHASEPLSMTDPEVGDAMFIVPVRDPANRVIPTRRFIEFDVLQTVQGIVLIRHADTPKFKVSREGVNVTSSQKLFTSSVVKQTRVVEASRPDLEKKTMYPFAHQTDPRDFMPIYYRYLKDLQVESQATRSAVKFKMAEHYFLNEYYGESLGLLRDILVDDPEYATSAGVRPMIAGNLFMMGRYDQAEGAFREILENKEMPEYVEEQKLWQWASARMIEQQNLVVLESKEKADIVTALNNYLPSYPYPLRRKLLMIYIDELLAESRTGAARKMFSDVTALDPTTEESEMLYFYEARALVAEGKQNEALARLKAVTENATSARVRTLAVVDYARIAKESGKITLPEAIAALEKGRIEWRGDTVEFSLLKLLGQYYVENNQYIEGLRVWRELVTQFSGTAESLKVSSAMAKVFVELFDTEGKAYQLPPLQALSTFFEFNELTPVGVQGDHISRLLADYLASVDLLENAAAILTHQVRYRSQGADRAELAAKLIDLHLANNRPDLAQEVLTAMAKEKIPEALKPRYQMLGAEMLVQQGKYPEALAKLEKDDSQTARDLRLAVYWHEQEWERVISVLEPELKARAEKIDTLQPKEEERVLRLAITYSKLRRFDDLKALKQLYGKRLKNPKIGDAFDFVSEKNEPVDHTSLDESLAVDKVRSFLGKYRLPKPAVPVPAPAPIAAPAEQKQTAAPAGEKKAEESKKEEKKAEEPKAKEAGK